jgi:hypothetical protein
MLECKFEIKDNKLVKKSNGEAIPEDEPVFILRGRDHLAVSLLQCYYSLSVQDGCNDYHMEMLLRSIKGFQDFADKHPERMKQPSITRGV